MTNIKLTPESEVAIKALRIQEDATNDEECWLIHTHAKRILDICDSYKRLVWITKRMLTTKPGTDLDVALAQARNAIIEATGEP